MIKVKAISRVMKDNPALKLTIVGFCDYTASDEYNMKLSEKRAKEVKRLMVDKYGVDADRLTVDWKGKTVAFGDIQYSLNRRVSFYRVIE
jgi:outer membrane protein OmpA-like peptidoglycan-associated protein